MNKIETVLVEFLSTVKHDLQRFEAGAVAEIEKVWAEVLIALGVAKPRQADQEPAKTEAAAPPATPKDSKGAQRK
ncbi:MAG: hypothetical protein QJR02_10160 [Sinobacteraceae bacterium]|nr:hypothetical protein [Nevskiaceae bacterium]